VDRQAAEKAVARIAATIDETEAAHEADLLSESIPEDPTLKKKVFVRFNELCPNRTIFTTNTSMLIPSVIAEATGRPDRFLAFHFHQPVWVGNVADIMPHPGTATKIVTLVRDFARSINQIPMVLRKENHGYIFNAMYSSLNRAAIALVANGIASVHDVDRAWMGIMKMPIGPLGMLDNVGLDTVLHISEASNVDCKDEQNCTNIEFLKKSTLTKGWFGHKNWPRFLYLSQPRIPGSRFSAGR